MFDPVLWKKGILNFPGPEKNLTLSPARIFRIVRIAAGTRFAVSSKVRQAVLRQVPATAELPASLVRRQFSAMLTGKNPVLAMELCRAWGLLRIHLPEVHLLKGVTQPPEFHPEGDVWTHTLQMLSGMFGADEVLAWSVLLHDIGKPRTRTVEVSGRIRFFNHETIGGNMADALCIRLAFPEEQRRRIVRAVAGHMKMTRISAMRPSTMEKLVKTSDFSLLLELQRLDCAGCHRFFEDYLLLLDKKAELDRRPEAPEPFLRGRDLKDAGLAPSPEFGRILQKAYRLQRDGKLSRRADALLWLQKILAGDRSRHFVPPDVSH